MPVLRIFGHRDGAHPAMLRALNIRNQISRFFLAQVEEACKLGMAPRARVDPEDRYLVGILLASS